MQDLKSIVADMYAAFRRGDTPAILAHLAPDVTWDRWADNHGQKAGVPFLQRRAGVTQVHGYFELLGTYTFHEVNVVAILGGDNKVVAEVVVDLTMPNGSRVRDEELHLFTFNPEGKVTAFRHYIDTAKAIAAAKN